MDVKYLFVVFARSAIQGNEENNNAVAINPDIPPPVDQSGEYYYVARLASVDH